MANILKAIKTIIENPISDLVNYYQGKNRINSVGDALECFIKDIFSEALDENDLNLKNQKYSEAFSYIGNQNNPPDIILKNSDAIEVKKIESLKSSIALNSSYPKCKLYSDEPMITNSCRKCEDWQEKDIIYAIGVVKDKKLQLLWLIYGDCYAADREIYQRIRNKINSGITEIPDVEFSETKELGRVNKVDPLGITYLRIRGMWGIKNPVFVYDYLFENIDINTFKLIAIMKKEKYLSFSSEARKLIEMISDQSFTIENVNIKSPNNPAQLISAKMISYRINN
ncbi:NgoPII family restriction endonuclease [Calothrix sp. CCY 0018]|uniref:NgoPII family restriction endonuclease n=1 Tax=Calothrix sp. CCY 0018 TaxID=3103864 RepID=UPI0039C729E1